ncbi:hypothetical protein GC176_26485 [bacterium]|nr:hypothetical protein [bacterium]
MRAALCVMAIVTAAPACAADMTAGMELELKAIAAREKLHSGHIVLTNRTTKGPFNRPADSAVDDTYRIDFDGHRQRTERTANRYGITKISIFAGDVYLQDPGVRDRETGDYLRAGSKEHVDGIRGGLGFTHDLFDPKILGCYPMPLFSLSRRTLEDGLAVADRREETVTEEILDGQAVQHISFLRSNGAAVQIWIAPDMNHAVLRMEAAGGGGRQTVRSHYRKYGDSTWYPQQVILTSYSGDRITEEQIATVEFAEFNTRISPDRFSLTSLNPEVGEIVRKDGHLLVWNGRTLTTATNARKPAPSGLSHLSYPWLATLWTVLAVLCGLAAFYLLSKSRRRA